ncbi:efflux transporter outer membrane subunit [Halomonas sp. MCCC 1A11036]|uniref:Efflux transporter outer membrane subunit n=1 Tax=Billgrantia zhangzhouensis TaxID=2733481 RepID=A0ABS9AIG4_9GAMM|nr:efflux transporter outer membrane subunit [Halomonas zhangzhouensis]MCE8021486.1 efflux transporter outer membrane subunit [Halomonas zhangzhouensis]
MRYLWSLVFVVALSGCASMGDVGNPRATLHTPESLGAMDTGWHRPSPHWWGRYHDPGLNALIDQALSQSPDIRLAQIRVSQAAAVVDQAGAERGPKVDGSARATRKRYAEQYDADAPLAGHYGSAYVLGAEARYTFDFWGRQRAALNVALGETAARLAEAQDAKVLLTSQIVKSWLELSRLLELRTLTEDALEMRTRALRIVESRVREGLDTEVERWQAEGELLATERDIAELDEWIGLQRNTLATLAGLPMDALVDAVPNVEPTRHSLPSSIPAELIGQRADVVAARWRVEVATQGVEAAKANFYPNINLRAFAGLARQGLSVGLSDWLDAGSRTYSIEPAISLPIFDAGRLRAQLKAQASELDAAVETYNQALLTAIRDVSNQLVSLGALEPQARAQERTLTARLAAFDLAERQYASGLTDYLTVLNARNALLQARKKQADIRSRALVLDAELHRALGGGFDTSNANMNFTG